MEKTKGGRRAERVEAAGLTRRGIPLRGAADSIAPRIPPGHVISQGGNGTYIRPSGDGRTGYIAYGLHLAPFLEAREPWGCHFGSILAPVWGSGGTSGLHFGPFGGLGDPWASILVHFGGLGGTKGALRHLDGALGCPNGALWGLLGGSWGVRGCLLAPF